VSVEVPLEYTAPAQHPIVVDRAVHDGHYFLDVLRVSPVNTHGSDAKVSRLYTSADAT